MKQFLGDNLEAGKFDSLSKIHKYLFEDIYQFAGEIRTENIAKGNFCFAPVMYLKSSLEHIDLMLKKEIHQVVDWSRVDKEDYLLAMERSPIKSVEIKELLKSVLTSNINNREVYMNGIDASYHYEGYNIFKSDDLI